MIEKCSNPYRPIAADVLDVITETPTIKTIRFRPEEEIAFQTGQFVEITIPGVGEAPFTPSSRPSVKDIMEVSVMKVGKVTDKIHELKTGDKIGVRGPLGTGYPVDDFEGKEVLVVGGGCGFAPLRSLMYELFDRSGKFKKIFFRGGCKTPKELVYRDETAKWSDQHGVDFKLTVDHSDEEWAGNVGVVTTILEGLEMDYAHGISVI